jgi:hypothetical protein
VRRARAARALLHAQGRDSTPTCGDANICVDLDDALERAKVVLAERQKPASAG